MIFRHTPGSLRRLVSRAMHAQFTASAGAVVVDDHGRVLLLEHVFRVGSGWGIPGGFLEAGEQPEQGLRRELVEEVGLEVTDVELAFVRAIGNAKQLEIIFRCRPKGEARPRGVEVKNAGWFSLDALPETLSDDQRRSINRAVANGANSVN